MAHILFENVNIDFPLYNSSARSLKGRFLNIATGGKIASDGGVLIVNALRDLSFEINEGDRVAIIGHNGSGKSTLLRVLSGVYEPASGRVLINGRVTSLIDISIGMDDESTGVENIFIRGSLLGLSREKILQELDNIIEFSELGDFIYLPVKTYSSGMHLRLAFSVSMALNPDILLMDEWLSVGDDRFKEKAELKLVELINKTKIMVMATHSPEVVRKVCNKVIKLEKGAVVAFGSTDSILL